MNSKALSNTYLFDHFRSGRMKSIKGKKEIPAMKWRFKLPSYPPKGPESTPAFDRDNNIYFGSHDHCFYSLDIEGSQRWMFKTGEKIYSSPTVMGDRVYFSSGDGNLFCFSLNGEFRWVYDVCNYFKRINNKYIRKLKQLQTRIKAYDPDRRKRWTVKCWSSPNLSDNGEIYITGYGLGLHAIRADDGSLLWSYDLGSPRHHLSGVVLNEHQDIFVASQRRYLHCLAPDGRKKWQFDTGLSYDIWGNPSIDVENHTVLFPLTFREKKGKLFALDYSGRKKWEADIHGGLRGSVAVSHMDYLVTGSLNGKLYFINRKTGKIMKDVQLTNAQRGLWTTPSIDLDGYIFITTKDSRHSGSLCCLTPEGHILWRITVGKALSTPVLDQNGCIYIGSWNGEFLCLQT